MADQSIVHIGENSPEEVALKLMRVVADVEGKVFHGNPGQGKQSADRKWILDTYAECLKAVKGYRTQPSDWPTEKGNNSNR